MDLYRDQGLRPDNPRCCISAVTLGLALLAGTVLGAEVPMGQPIISISRDISQIRIAFAGTLQSAMTVTGPWLDLTNVSNPYLVNAASGQRFYRSRHPDSILASTSVVFMAVTGPLQKHFDLAYAGLPDGIFPPVREKPPFDGIVTVPGFTVPATLRVRGNSSLQECPFPKLKLKVGSDERVLTPFFDAREIKIGTHCAEGGRGTIGRLREEIAAYREALAYEVMNVLGFISPRVRRASIQYHDTTSTNDNPIAGWQVTRLAMIFDDVEVVAERLGGRALDDEEVAALTDARFEPQLIGDLQFLHALLGNWDYRLSVDGRGLWNTEVIAMATGQLVPMAGDFDLCSWVTEVVKVSAPHDYWPELPAIDRQARYELEQIQGRVSRAIFDQGRSRFMGKRSAIEAQIAGAMIDEVGRSNAVRHVTAFYDALR
jgi:hypothetical protein